MPKKTKKPPNRFYHEESRVPAAANRPTAADRAWEQQRINEFLSIPNAPPLSKNPIWDKETINYPYRLDYNNPLDVANYERYQAGRPFITETSTWWEREGDLLPHAAALLGGAAAAGTGLYALSNWLDKQEEARIARNPQPFPDYYHNQRVWNPDIKDYTYVIPPKLSQQLTAAEREAAFSERAHKATHSMGYDAPWRDMAKAQPDQIGAKPDTRLAWLSHPDQPPLIKSGVLDGYTGETPPPSWNPQEWNQFRDYAQSAPDHYQNWLTEQRAAEALRPPLVPEGYQSPVNPLRLDPQVHNDFLGVNLGHEGFRYEFPRPDSMGGTYKAATPGIEAQLENSIHNWRATQAAAEAGIPHTRLYEQVQDPNFRTMPHTSYLKAWLTPETIGQTAALSAPLVTPWITAAANSALDALGLPKLSAPPDTPNSSIPFLDSLLSHATGITEANISQDLTERLHEAVKAQTEALYGHDNLTDYPEGVIREPDYPTLTNFKNWLLDTLESFIDKPDKDPKAAKSSSDPYLDPQTDAPTGQGGHETQPRDWHGRWTSR